MAALLLAVALAGCLGGTDGNVSESARAPSGDRPQQPPEPETGAGDRRHVHDHWGDREQLTLMQHPVLAYVAHNHLFDEPPQPQHTHNCERSLQSTDQGGTVFFSLPPGHIVPPGTEAVHFTFSWDTQTITGLKFGYISPASAELQMVGEVGNGYTNVVNVTPEMTDPGHATESRWLLYLCAGGDGPANVAQGEVDVKAVAHRAQEIPKEPAHPDHWDGHEAIPLATGTYQGRSAGALHRGDGVWVPLSTLSDSIVPPDAAEVLVWGRLHTSGQSPVPPSDLTLYVNHPGMGPYNWSRMEADDVSHENHTWTWRIPVSEDNDDGMYTNETFWAFWIRAERDTIDYLYGTWSHPFVDPSVEIEAAAYAVKNPGSLPPAVRDASPCRATAC